MTTKLDRLKFKTGPKGPIKPPGVAQTERLGLTLTPSELAWLRAVSLATGRPVATLCRAAILERYAPPPKK